MYLHTMYLRTMFIGAHEHGHIFAKGPSPYGLAVVTTVWVVYLSRGFQLQRSTPLIATRLLRISRGQTCTTTLPVTTDSCFSEKFTDETSAQMDAIYQTRSMDTIRVRSDSSDVQYIVCGSSTPTQNMMILKDKRHEDAHKQCYIRYFIYNLQNFYSIYICRRVYWRVKEWVQLFV